jgi:hypothetical protein
LDFGLPTNLPQSEIQNPKSKIARPAPCRKIRKPDAVPPIYHQEDHAMREIMLTALLAALAPAAVAAAMPVIGKEVGQVYPQVVLPSLDGKRALALSDFRGKKVILIEYASW